MNLDDKPTTHTGQETLLDIALNAPEQERPKDLVQRLDDLLALFLVSVTRSFVLVQEAVKVTIVGKDFRTDEVEQREELLHAILQGSTCDEKTTSRQERADNLGQHGVGIFDTVGLVDDDVLEGELLQRGALAQAQLIRSDENIEVLRDKSVGDNLRSLFLGSRKDGDIHIWCPISELSSPILERRFRNNNQVRTVDVFVVLQIGKEGDSL